VQTKKEEDQEQMEKGETKKEKKKDKKKREPELPAVEELPKRRRGRPPRRYLE